MKQPYHIAILGYGSQGRAWARNLYDSGYDFTIGIPTGDPSRKVALKDGQKKITTVRKAVKTADIIVFAFPDHLHGRIYEKQIAPGLRTGATLVFLHGYSIHFGIVQPPGNCPVILLAPLGPGLAVREKFLNHDSVAFFYGFHFRETPPTRSVLKYLIRGLRIDRKKMIKTTFRDEAVGDLFGEQAVLCGGLTRLIKAGYETLRGAGLSSDKAYLEVAYQLDLIVDLIKNYGIEGMYRRISVAARYGSVLSGPRIIDARVENEMKKILSEIEDGHFARKLNALDTEKTRKIDSSIKKMTSPALEKSARKFKP